MATLKSFLSAFGHDFVTALHWVGSASGQADISAGEAIANTVVTAVNPIAGAAMLGVEAIINAGLKQVVAMEASAAAVGVQSGTGAQKSAAVVAALAPQAESLLVAFGVPAPTAEQIQSLTTAISNGIVTILNSLPAPATATAAA